MKRSLEEMEKRLRKRSIILNFTPFFKPSKVSFGVKDGYVYEDIETPDVSLFIHKGRIMFLKGGYIVSANLTESFNQIELELKGQGISNRDALAFEFTLLEALKQKIILVQRDEEYHEFVSRVAKTLVDVLHIKTIEGTKILFAYVDGVYKKEFKHFVDLQLVSIIPPEELERHFVRDVALEIMRITSTPAEKFNPDPFILNVKNGLLDLRTLQLKPHTPDFLSITKIPVNYNPNAKCERWEKIVREIVAPEDIATLQEIFGYMLFGKIVTSKIFLLIGSRDDILKVLKMLIGDNFTVDFLEFTFKYPWHSADLFGKLAISEHEPLSLFKRKSLSIFKNKKAEALLSGCKITGREKYDKPFTFRNQAKFIASIHKLPEQDDLRFVKVRVLKYFNELEKSTIPEDLSSELSGILNWSLEGLKRLMQNSFYFSNES